MSAPAAAPESSDTSGVAEVSADAGPPAAAAESAEPSPDIETPPPAGDAPAEEELPQRIEDIDLETLLMQGLAVGSASRAIERIEEAPATITVITREQMNRWGYQSIAQLLEHIVGFYVQDDGMIPNVAVRGVTGGLRAESGLLKVMIDGVPVSFRPTGGNWLGPELVPLSAIERIEIARGPNSAVYGADAFLAVINVVTRDAGRLDGAEMRVYGNYAGGLGGGLDMSVGGRHGDVSALAAVRLDRQDRSGLQLPSSSPSPQLRAGVMRDTPVSGFLLDSASVLTRVSYRPTDGDGDPTGTSLTLLGNLSLIGRNGAFSDLLQLAGGLDDAGRQRGTQLSLARGFLDLSGEVVLIWRDRGDDFERTRVPELTLRSNFTYSAGAPLPDEHFDIGSDVSYARRVFDFNAVQLNASLQWEPIDQLRFVGGGDFLFDYETLPGAQQVLYARVGDTAAGQIASSDLGGTLDFLNGGVYLLSRWAVIPELQLNAGVRVDGNSIYGLQINGRGGVSYQPAQWLTFKLNYNSAFRAPTPLLLYGRPLAPGDILGNAGLRPQQIHSGELNIAFSQRTGTGPLDPNSIEWLHVETTLSYSTVLNKASFTQIGLNDVARNLAEVDVLAWETEARLNIDNQLRAYGNVGFVAGSQNLHDVGYVAQIQGSGLEIYPTLMISGGASYQFPADIPLRLNVEAQYIGARRASNSNVLANGGVYTIPEAFFLDASIALVNVHFFEDRATTISLDVRNILDNRAAQPGYSGIDYPTAQRSIMLMWQQEL